MTTAKHYDLTEDGIIAGRMASTLVERYDGDSRCIYLDNDQGCGHTYRTHVGLHTMDDCSFAGVGDRLFWTEIIAP